MVARPVAVWAFGLALSVAPLAAQDRQGAITGVIDGQMTAFRAGDTEAAFGFASPTIRGIFGTPETFGRMVAQGYPPIWQPGEVRYHDLREERGRLQQRVELRDASGRSHFYDYEMVQTESGWKINGVRPAPPPATGV